MSTYSENMHRPLGDVLRELGYQFDESIDAFTHTGKTRSTHPVTFRIVRDVVLDARYHEFALDAIDFENSLHGTPG